MTWSMEAMSRVIYITGLTGMNPDAEMAGLRALEFLTGEVDAYVIHDDREHAPPPTHFETRGITIHLRGALDKSERLAGLLVCGRFGAKEQRLVERAQALGAAVVHLEPGS